MPAFVFWLTEMAVVQGSACLSLWAVTTLTIKIY